MRNLTPITFAVALLLSLASPVQAQDCQGGTVTSPCLPTSSEDQVVGVSEVIAPYDQWIQTYSATEAGYNLQAFFEFGVEVRLLKNNVEVGRWPAIPGVTTKSASTQSAPNNTYEVYSIHYVYGSSYSAYRFGNPQTVQGVDFIDAIPCGSCTVSTGVVGNTYWAVNTTPPSITNITNMDGTSPVFTEWNTPQACLKILGSHLTAGGDDPFPYVEFSGSGVIATSTTAVSDGEIDVCYSVDGAPATQGSHSISVTTYAGAANPPGTMTVLDAPDNNDFARLNTIGIFRAVPDPNNPKATTQAIWYVDTNNDFKPDAGDQTYSFGVYDGNPCDNANPPHCQTQKADMPITVPWTVNGPLVMGVFRSGYWYLDANNNGMWDCNVNSLCPDQSVAFGQDGDIPVVGDWNHDGHMHIGVVRKILNPSDSTSGALYWYVQTGCADPKANVCDYDPNHTAVFNWGQVANSVSDAPVLGDWNGKGYLRIGVNRPGSGWILNLQTDPGDIVKYNGWSQQLWLNRDYVTARVSGFLAETFATVWGFGPFNSGTWTSYADYSLGTPTTYTFNYCDTNGQCGVPVTGMCPPVQVPQAQFAIQDVTIAPGAQGTTQGTNALPNTVAITGFTGMNTPNGLPTGISLVGALPSIAPGQFSLSFTAQSSAIPGDYLIEASFSNGPIQVGSCTTSSETQPFWIHVKPPTSDFSLSVGAQTPPNIAPGTTGSSATYSVTITGSNGLSVSLAAIGLPNGSNATFSPSGNIAVPGSATMTIAVPGGTQPGNYSFTLRGTEGSLTHDISVSLNVVAVVPPKIVTENGTTRLALWYFNPFHSVITSSHIQPNQYDIDGYYFAAKLNLQTSNQDMNPQVIWHSSDNGTKLQIIAAPNCVISKCVLVYTNGPSDPNVNSGYDIDVWATYNGVSSDNNCPGPNCSFKVFVNTPQKALQEDIGEFCDANGTCGCAATGDSFGYYNQFQYTFPDLMNNPLAPIRGTAMVINPKWFNELYHSNEPSFDFPDYLFDTDLEVMEINSDWDATERWWQVLDKIQIPYAICTNSRGNPVVIPAPASYNPAGTSQVFNATENLLIGSVPLHPIGSDSETSPNKGFIGTCTPYYCSDGYQGLYGVCVQHSLATHYTDHGSVTSIETPVPNGGNVTNSDCGPNSFKN